MGARRVVGMAVGVMMSAAVLAWPATGGAEHVSVGGSIAADVERAGPSSWRIEIDFTIVCHGAGAKGASHQGNLYLVDQDSGERIYLGGVSGAAGHVAQLVSSKGRWQRFVVLLQASCFDNETLHGSDTVEIHGGFLAIPPRFRGGAGAGGGGNGGKGDGQDGGDPTAPLRSGGCARLTIGSNSADSLLGGAAGDVVFALGAADLVRGGAGHDCLLGEAGRDLLQGEGGHDRLTGGKGADRLLGGPGVNAYDAGAGRDFVDARNGAAETVRCGPGRDRARVDRGDELSSCETAARPGA